MKQFPKVTTPRMHPRNAPNGLVRGGARPVNPALGPRRLVYGAPHTTLRWSENHAPQGFPWGSENETVTARFVRPVWTSADFIPRTPGFEGAPFGPGLEGAVPGPTPGGDFEAIRQQAERVAGRPIPTETELRARLGPSFDLSRYQESVRRLAALGAGYPVLLPGGGSAVYPDVPSTSGRSLVDSARNVFDTLGGVLGPIAIIAGLMLVLPLLKGGRR